MADEQISDRIEALVKEEHELLDRGGQERGLDEAGHRRLEEIRVELDRYWDLLRQPTGEQWIVITAVVEDPTYLTRTWITSLNFKKEANGSKWDPSACEAS